MWIANVLVAVTGTVLSPPHSINPLKPAEEGFLQCWRPDFRKKTCRVIAAYRRTGPKIYDDVAIVAISSRGPLTVKTHTPVIVEGDAVCGFVRTQDIQTGALREGKRNIAAADARPILAEIVRMIAPLDGQETCTRYEQTGSGFIAKISIAGRYRPEWDSKVKWITPVEGYTVAP